ncbi:MAG: hypothetical protein ACPGU5_07880 [Lishizhenia sp.]
MKKLITITATALLCFSCTEAEKMSETTTEIQQEIEMINTEVEKLEKTTQELNAASSELDNALNNLN